MDIARQTLDASKRAFEASNRPYVYLQGGRLGGSFNSDRMELSARVKNCGNYLATQVRISWIGYSDGNSIHNQTIPPLLLEPDEEREIKTTIVGAFWPAIQSGKTFQIEIDIEYKGITDQEYFYREWYQWDKDAASTRTRTEAN